MVVMSMYVVNDDDYGLLVSLISMCEVMGPHMYISLVGLDWDYE